MHVNSRLQSELYCGGDGEYGGGDCVSLELYSVLLCLRWLDDL